MKLKLLALFLCFFTYVGFAETDYSYSYWILYPGQSVEHSWTPFYHDETYNVTYSEGIIPEIIIGL